MWGENDIHIDCEKEPKYVNYQEHQCTISKDSNTWKKEVSKIKYAKNITFPEARKMVEIKKKKPTQYQQSKLPYVKQT